MGPSARGARRPAATTSTTTSTSTSGSSVSSAGRPAGGDGARRAEILETAARLFASSGLQTSLKEIAEACGILPGSLYHHFDSKEAIVLELVHRFVDDLDRVADEALQAGTTGGPDDVEARIVTCGRAVAACAVRHRAALLLTLYEPPTVLGDELAQLAARVPQSIEAAMLELLRQGRAGGAVRPGVDLALLSDRLCQSMLHIGVGMSYREPGGEQVPELRLRIPLYGVAVRPPTNGALDRSAAIRAVDEVIAAWDDEDDGDDRALHLRTVARREFGRRGYESTTMRDIAAAAGLSTGTVYRSFASKDELLVSIMGSYQDKAKTVWRAAMRAGSSPLETLDALVWANIHLVDRFSDEFKIQLAWLRQSPPASVPDLGQSFAVYLRHIKAVLAGGARAGELRVEGPTAELRARCLYEATMVPPSITGAAGPRAAQAFTRDTVVRGAMAGPRRPA